MIKIYCDFLSVFADSIPVIRFFEEQTLSDGKSGSVLKFRQNQPGYIRKEPS